MRFSFGFGYSVHSLEIVLKSSFQKAPRRKIKNAAPLEIVATVAGLEIVATVQRVRRRVRHADGRAGNRRRVRGRAGDRRNRPARRWQPSSATVQRNRRRVAGNRGRAGNRRRVQRNRRRVQRNRRRVRRRAGRVLTIPCAPIANLGALCRR